MQGALQILSALRKGRFLDELSEEIKEVARAVRLAQQRRGSSKVKGVVTIELTIAASTDETILDVFDQIKSKVPGRVGGRSIFFDTPDGELTRTDPRQQEMSLREVVREARKDSK